MRENNYTIQANQAKKHFLTYDQQALVRKFHLRNDENYLYLTFLSRPYRVCRGSGDLEKWTDGGWQDGNSYEEVMTILDLLCDAREDRRLSGNWKSMQNFGLMFHQNLLEERRNPNADYFDRHPEAFRAGCLALGGVPIPGGDMAYAVELFDGLSVGVQFWHGDEDFFPRLRYLWDENALQYIRYETMFFAVGLLMDVILECAREKKEL